MACVKCIEYGADEVTCKNEHVIVQELHEGRLVTYFGCLACPANRTCPPPTGWPPGQRVPVRELQGLTSPWYFNAIPPEPEATLKVPAFIPDPYVQILRPFTDIDRCQKATWHS